MFIRTRLLKIAKGNTTALVYNCPKRLRKAITAQLLKYAEQVGFVDGSRLEMMGGELCVNATLAFASTLSKRGKLFASGINGPVNYANNKTRTTICLPLKYKRICNILLFKGIGFMIANKKISKIILSKLCKKYGLPAFGAINYKENNISPYVYVKETGSFVKETACGSGSIAFSIFSGKRKIIQPSGGVIYVRLGKRVRVSAQVTEDGENNLFKSRKTSYSIKRGEK